MITRTGTDHGKFHRIPLPPDRYTDTQIHTDKHPTVFVGVPPEPKNLHYYNLDAFAIILTSILNTHVLIFCFLFYFLCPVHRIYNISCPM